MTATAKGFCGDPTVIPEAHRPEGSTNAELYTLPVRRKWTHDCKGLLLYLPRTDMVVVPVAMYGSPGESGASCGYHCIVVRGTPRYPRGGYEICVSDWELQRAVEVQPDLSTMDLKETVP